MTDRHHTLRRPGNEAVSAATHLSLAAAERIHREGIPGDHTDGAIGLNIL